MGLAEPLLRSLSREGYDQATPIQEAAIGPLKQQRDLVGIAQTGTGKTAAFMLPILHRLAQDNGQKNGQRPRSLILAPTRELAGQIEDAARRYGKFMRVSTTLVIGGASSRNQLRALQRRPDIIVATPGRLLDHMTNANLDIGQMECVVLDEADQMLDMGFLPAIRRIMAALPRKRQTVLLSATMPREIRALAADFMQDPVEVSVAPAATPVELIDQQALSVAASDKRQKLTEILRGDNVTRAIVFTRTKRGADRVTRHLEQGGLSAAALHGNKSQNQRERILASFKAGKVRTLVATDIAARGIDIDSVSHVINFELPNVPEAYVHRIGRTARAGASGQAISLVDVAEHGLLRDIEKLIGRVLLPTRDGEKNRNPRRGPKPAHSQAKATTSSRQPKSGSGRRRTRGRRANAPSAQAA
ncbi:MAG: DEAD/DEAH box helicase [Kiloniellales bacterium]